MIFLDVILFLYRILNWWPEKKNSTIQIYGILTLVKSSGISLTFLLLSLPFDMCLSVPLERDHHIFPLQDCFHDQTPFLGKTSRTVGTVKTGITAPSWCTPWESPLATFNLCCPFSVTAEKTQGLASGDTLEGRCSPRLRLRSHGKAWNLQYWLEPWGQGR